MAKKKRGRITDTSYERAFGGDQSDKANRILNLALGMAEKIGVETPIDREFKVASFRQVAANTRNPSRPRAQAIGYDSSNMILYVVFRDGTWWEYREVEPEHFENLKNARSTGDYLREHRFDSGAYDMGPANLDSLSSERKERLSYAAEASARLQQTLILEQDEVQLRGQQ